MNPEIKDREELSDHELETRYKDMLDECYETIKVCGYEYQPSRVLEEVDPVAFRCGFADWLNSMIGEGIDEIDGKYYDEEE